APDRDIPGPPKQSAALSLRRHTRPSSVPACDGGKTPQELDAEVEEFPALSDVNSDGAEPGEQRPISTFLASSTAQGHEAFPFTATAGSQMRRCALAPRGGETTARGGRGGGTWR
ncbi:unnamed protein product, partial [Lampetra fluviatilis]